jgi:hypothetical protein
MTPLDGKAAFHVVDSALAIIEACHLERGVLKFAKLEDRRRTEAELPVAASKR